MIKQQSDMHKLLTVAGAAIVSLALFSFMLYAFYWDENTPSQREIQNRDKSSQPAGEHKSGGH